ncbi:MAG: sensor domain-containing diguanylate cyclase [Bacilli bacterium]|jgi:diguanylate cyclase (GGDEF)-like protein|nr:sensor domain-containing diguanylate cyclase [Bacilli bacterium]
MFKKYHLISLLMILVTGLIAVFFYLYYAKQIAHIQAEATYSIVYDQKKIFLKETVTNQINRIEERKQRIINQYEQLYDDINLHLTLESTLPANDFITYYTELLTSSPYHENVVAVLWDTATNTLYFDSHNLIESADPSADLNLVLDTFHFYHFQTYSSFTAFLAITDELIYQNVLSDMRMEIHASSFENDTYIWVNEIVNFDGGDNYAIRLIHPNLIATEGSYLSTSMTDIKGNTPYQTELDGIKADGEIFFTYYFKRMLTDEIALKLTYAGYYEDFQWIVAMGIYVEDVNHFINENTNTLQLLTNRLGVAFLSIILGIIGLSFAIQKILESYYLKKTTSSIQEESNRDVLTQTLLRRIGIRDLQTAFDYFKQTNKSPIVLYFDMDDLKAINDMYGHDAGDLALQKCITAIQTTTRTTDKIYRWGGDEFLVLVQEFDIKKTELIANRILGAIKGYSLQWKDQFISLSVSIGVSYFIHEDQDIHAILKRMDSALYASKNNGKGKITIETTTKN